MSEREKESDRYRRLADLIEDDPEWFASDEVDDDYLVDALRIAAGYLESMGK